MRVYQGKAGASQLRGGRATAFPYCMRSFPSCLHLHRCTVNRPSVVPNQLHLCRLRLSLGRFEGAERVHERMPAN